MFVEIFCVFVILLFIIGIYLRSKKTDKIVFFHPNCLDGGGGEKVLWQAIKALHTQCPDLPLSIYSQNATTEKANESVFRCFKVNPPTNLSYINVGPATFLLPGRFKHLTLILQALSSMLYAFKCLFKCVPAVVIDTTGAPFGTAIWKLFGGCTVILYVHYPFISTDMLHSVQSKQSKFNNDATIAKSSFLTNLKSYYYSLLAFFYSFTGRFSDVVMVNSTWTSNHIHSIYGKKPTIVYPPCDCDKLTVIPTSGRESGLIISIGQFRPEKNLPLQLDIMEKLTEAHPELNPHLVIIGGCRNASDEALKNSIQSEIDRRNLPVVLRPNVPYDELLQWLGKASVGIHTMRDEHFGICVVEYMAAGLIPIANNSAGPHLDIVQDEEYLASTAEEYAEKVAKALKAKDSTRDNFRTKSLRFRSEAFDQAFIEVVLPVLHSTQ